MKPKESKSRSGKRKTIRQIEIDTYTDDKTVSEFLKENRNPNYQPPYSRDFISKFNIGNPTP